MEKIKDYGWERGRESERKVLQVLEGLKAEGIIKNCGQSLEFSQEDMSGRDFLIATHDDKIIWLQVKSSFNTYDKEKYLKRRIHHIAVGDKSLPEIKEEILGILKTAGNKKRNPKIGSKVKVSV